MPSIILVFNNLKEVRAELQTRNTAADTLLTGNSSLPEIFTQEEIRPVSKLERQKIENPARIDPGP